MTEFKTTNDVRLMGGFIENEYAQGYHDGLKTDNPWPNENRSEFYKHSFTVGRAEADGNPIPAHISRERAAGLEAEHEA